MVEVLRAPCDEGTLRAGATQGCEPAWRPWVLATSILGSSLAFIVGSAVNVALPAMQTGLGATAPQMQWVMNAYLLFLGALILVGGAAGDRYGRRRVFVLGVGVFSLASVWSGLAPDVAQLVIARSVQGVGGALLVPNSLALISAAYPSDERGKAIGTWAAASALTTALGPVLGGALVDAFSWRWVFFVVVPLALAALAIARWRVPESRSGSCAPLDWAGAALGTAALGALCYGLIASSERGWSSAPVVLALAGALLLSAGFLVREARAREPMMPLSLFRSATFSGANAMTLLLYAALGGALFFLPFELVQVRGYSATEAGAALLPISVLLGGLSRQAGGLLDRFGARAPLTVGPAIASLGLFLLAWLAGAPDASGGYWTTVFPGLTVLGLGLTVSVAPLTTTVLNAVPAGREGVASGVNNAAARVAGLLAVAALGAVAIAVFGRALDARLARLEVAPELRAELLEQRRDLAALRVPDDVAPARAEELERAIDGAFTVAFRWTTALTAVLALGGGVCAAATIRSRGT